MKKLLLMLVVLFVIYFGIQIAFNFFGKGDENEYQIENNGVVLNVYEKSSFRLENNEDNYYFKVEGDDKIFTFQIFKDFSKHQQIIEDIKTFKNDQYSCIVPIFKNDLILIDALCEKDGLYTYAHKLNDNNINEFLRTVPGYDANVFGDEQDFSTINKMKINEKVLLDNFYINLSSYQGILTISKHFNNTVRDINVFKKDVYDHKLATFIDNYYLVADYNSNYNFNEFFLIDFVKLKTTSIKYDTKISFDSYIQGIVDHKVYIYDKENSKQYEVNVVNGNVSSVGNATDGIMYYNNGWTKITIAEANQGKLFINSSVDYENPKYERIDKIDQYYYLYEKVSSGYKVYRKNIQDENIVYLFDTSKIDNIIYIANSIYYIDGNQIKTYSDLYGNKTILVYDELQFNPKIHFGVYKK